MNTINIINNKIKKYKKITNQNLTDNIFMLLSNIVDKCK